MIKDILVHLDGSNEDKVRMAHAEALGREHSAMLTGLFTLVLPAYAALSANLHGSAMAGYETALRTECEASLEKLRHEFKNEGKSADLRKIEGTIGNIEVQVALEARRADLFVGSCPYRLGNACWDAMIEAVMLEGARGLYLVPPGCPVPAAFRSALVAWRDTRQCTRAIAEAMPLLTRAERTRVAYVAETSESDGAAGGAMSRLASYLIHHGVKVELQTLEGNRGSVADLILGAAHASAADFIVFGAYGRSRFKEWLAGGTTRGLICQTTVPLIVAH